MLYIYIYIRQNRQIWFWWKSKSNYNRKRKPAIELESNEEVEGNSATFRINCWLASARHDILNGVIPVDDDFLHVGFFNLGRYLATKPSKYLFMSFSAHAHNELIQYSQQPHAQATPAECPLSSPISAEEQYREEKHRSHRAPPGKKPPPLPVSSRFWWPKWPRKVENTAKVQQIPIQIAVCTGAFSLSCPCAIWCASLTAAFMSRTSVTVAPQGALPIAKVYMLYYSCPSDNSADVLNSGHHGLIWCSRFG